MKNLIIGDVHGYFDNLRQFLLAQNVINEQNERINRDTIKVYSTGDLIDGGKNRTGDLLLLEYADEWFDAICLGNHEMSFIGGKEFGSRRKKDRSTLFSILNLISKGVYVPSCVVGKYLLVHGGFSERWGFKSVEEADSYIKVMWELADDDDSHDGVPVIDWVGPVRGYTNSDEVGGIFQLDWTERRNIKFSQIVGHTSHRDGPIRKFFRSTGQEHWNVDVEGKMGHAIGGVIYDDETNKTHPVFWGDRNGTTGKVITISPKPKEEKPEEKKYNLYGSGVKELSQVNGGVSSETNTNGSDDEVTYVKIRQPNEDASLSALWKDIGRDHARSEIVNLDVDDLDINLIDDLDIREIYLEEISRIDSAIAATGMLH